MGCGFGRLRRALMKARGGLTRPACPRNRDGEGLFFARLEDGVLWRDDLQSRTMIHTLIEQSQKEAAIQIGDRLPAEKIMDPGRHMDFIRPMNESLHREFFLDPADDFILLPAGKRLVPPPPDLRLPGTPGRTLRAARRGLAGRSLTGEQPI